MTKHHVHKHKKMNLGTKNSPRIVYRCILPVCSNYYDSPKLMVGKEGICNRCGKVFIYRESMFSPRWPLKPHCDDCTVRKSKKKESAEKAAEKVLEGILGIKLDD